jgi:phosphatidylglycerol lysyltransferase
MASEPDQLKIVAALQRVKWWLIGVVVIIVAVLLVHALSGLLHEFSYDDLMEAIRATRGDALGLAIVATIVSYLALTGYDISALRYVRSAVGFRVAAQTSFIAYALSNTVGAGVLTGGAVRLRLYGAAGVEAGAISRVIAFNAVAFMLGISVVGAAALLWGATSVAPALRIPAPVLQVGASVVLAGAATLVFMCRDGRERRLFGRFTLRLPSATLALQQLLFSVVDIAATAAVLWFLLPTGAIDFPAFLGFFAIAVVLGVLSHVPGGLGVFEAVMLLALRNHVPAESLAAALVLYRLIYYLLPLLLAMALLLLHEVRRGTVTPVTRSAVSLAPLLLATYAFIIGLMLLVSGVTPATDEATELLSLHVPLPLVEASHFIGSIAGLGLLFVARGIVLRLDAAWWAGLLLGIVSIVVCLPKGIAISEAFLIGFLVLALSLSRRQFNRRAALLAQPFSGGWLLSLGIVILGLTGMLLFVYRDVDYAQQLWWQFEFDAHAPRSLRALVAVAMLAVVLALRQLLRPPAAPLAKPGPAELERAADILRRQSSVDACVALMGDKHFLFSDSGNAFIMFGRRGRSWISLFDPTGPESEWPELVWRFLERARGQGGRASFYQVRPQTLPVYLDAGLHVYKLGEYAYVPLADFSLKGKMRSDLRQALNRGEREGMSLEVLPAGVSADTLAELHAISDAWLAEHAAAEKGFSLGAFSTPYIQRSPIALVRVGTRTVAFATLMTTDLPEEASIDLMRHLPDAPHGTMDFLFAKLLLHFQSQGLRRFGLGMAPLSGMATHPLAPRWHRLGRLLFAHGEHFYNFQGLRAFKEKFSPRWEPRYLAAPGGMTPLLVLADVAALISGRLRGIVAK